MAHINSPSPENQARSPRQVESRLPQGQPIKQKNIFMRVLSACFPSFFGTKPGDPAQMQPVQDEQKQNEAKDPDLHHPQENRFFGPVDPKSQPGFVDLKTVLKADDSLVSNNANPKKGEQPPVNDPLDLNQKLNGRKLGHVLTHHFIKDNQHGSTTPQIIGMSNAANAVFCEMVNLPPDIKDAVKASDHVEQTLASGEGFSTAFNTHFESHSVLTLSGLGTTSHSIGANVYKKDDGFHVVLCNRGLGSKKHGHFFEVVIPDQEASVAMNTLVELKQLDDINKVYDALAKFEKIKHEDIASSQLVGNCGWANKEAALKELAFKMCGGNQGIKGVYKPFRAAMLAKLETYVDSFEDDELKDAMARYNDFQTHTGGIKAAISALPDPPKDNDFDAVLDEIMTGILTEPDEAGAEAHLERYSYYVKKVIDENNPPKGINRFILIDIHNSFIDLQEGLREESSNSTELLNAFKDKITQFKSSAQLATSFRDKLSVCESFDALKKQIESQDYTGADFQLFRDEITKIFIKLKDRLKAETHEDIDVYKAWVLVANADSPDALTGAITRLNNAQKNQALMMDFRDQVSKCTDVIAIQEHLNRLDLQGIEFNFCRSIMLETAKRFFAASGGTFTTEGVWETKTPIQRSLFGLANAKYFSHCDQHLKNIATIRSLQSDLEEIGDDDYDGFFKKLNDQSIEELTILQCRVLLDKMGSQFKTVPHNDAGRLVPDDKDLETIKKLLTKQIKLNERIETCQKANYKQVLDHYNGITDVFEKLELCERVVSFSSDYISQASNQFGDLLPDLRKTSNYKKALKRYNEAKTMLEKHEVCTSVLNNNEKYSEVGIGHFERIQQILNGLK
ncbi:MAG: hypothetical protein ACON35_06170 [Candidatus Marinamargulisbacteria bacterium]